MSGSRLQDRPLRKSAVCVGFRQSGTVKPPCMECPSASASSAKLVCMKCPSETPSGEDRPGAQPVRQGETLSVSSGETAGAVRIGPADGTRPAADRLTGPNEVRNLYCGLRPHISAPLSLARLREYQTAIHRQYTSYLQLRQVDDSIKQRLYIQKMISERRFQIWQKQQKKDCKNYRKSKHS